jgi:hypothetical protein
VLAHTFYPPPNPEPIAGDMHLNYDESWSVNGALRLLPVMLHELGHALGLGHSDDPAAVMYPYYQGLEKLSPSDITALQALYAAPVTGRDAPPSDTPDNGTPTLNTPASNPPAGGDTPPGNTPGNTPPSNTPQSDYTAPVVTIYAPTRLATATCSDTLTVRGFATDNVGVTALSWASSAGGAGAATLANPFVIQAIPLVQGVNRITITALDAAGNAGTALLTVTKK